MNFSSLDCSYGSHSHCNHMVFMVMQFLGSWVSRRSITISLSSTQNLKHHYYIHLPTNSNKPKNRINSKFSIRENLKPFLRLSPSHVPLFFCHLSYQSLWYEIWKPFSQQSTMSFLPYFWFVLLFKDVFLVVHGRVRS